MKQIVFTYNDIKSINIGDYIQSIAAKQFSNSEIVYVNRDELSLYDGEDAMVIMNGWYTYKPLTCLPNNHMKPLFVAFHLNAEIKDEFLSFKNISILQKYAPIGCRDIYTMETLQKVGIDAYYSGCLTLTLGYNFDIPPKNGDIFVVDPYAYMPNGKNLIEIFKAIIQFFLHIHPVLKLLHKYKKDNKFKINFSKIGIGRVLLVTKTYLLLKQIFDSDLIWKARYITQFYQNAEYPTDEARFQRAIELLQLYGGASYVVTSRIHCAFPCLGFNTPVAYIKNDKDAEKSLCRLGNVADLLHIVETQGEKVVSSFLEGKFSSTTSFTNKKTYLKYRNDLISTCVKFFSK